MIKTFKKIYKKKCSCVLVIYYYNNFNNGKWRTKLIGIRVPDSVQ